MKRIFISHPLYSEGDVAENFCKVHDICREILEAGDLPISPIHLFSFIEEETKEQRISILAYCERLMTTCDEFYSYGNRGGCLVEKMMALERGLKITNKGGMNDD